MGRRGYRVVSAPVTWTPVECIGIRWASWRELVTQSLAPAVVLARAYGGYQGA
jgi:hypothetical protein